LSSLNKIKESKFGVSLYLLNRIDRYKIFLITFIQTLLGFLDLAGIVLIGALGALTVQGIESQKPGNKVGFLLKYLGMEHLNFQKQVAILGLLTSLLLILKTLISAFINRRIMFFLAAKSAEISSILMAKILSQDLLELRSLSNQQILYISTNGVTTILTGILSATLAMLSDFFNLLIILCGIFILDPIVSSFTFIIFSALAYLLYKSMHAKSREIGLALNELSVQSNQKILEILDSFKEIVIRNRQGYYYREITNLRKKMSNLTAMQTFQPMVSKYVVESVAILATLVISAFEFGTKNATHAVATLTVFLLASSRIVPTILRLQQGAIVLKGNSGLTQSTFALIKKLEDGDESNLQVKNPDFEYKTFKPEISISELSFTYGPDLDAIKSFKIVNLNLSIGIGNKIAIVGPSGAGKSTLVDLILGVLNPTKGSIKISGVSPRLASKNWPGAISYVPQQSVITSGSVRVNVAQGFDEEIATRQRVESALESAQLLDFVKKLPGGIDSPISEMGSSLSGGQRQRLAIARALFTKPKLLVLDEATSSLDSVTEFKVSQEIESLSKEVTVIIIAHRLSTVLNCDQIIYLDEGEVKAIGTFGDVKKIIPDFEIQAKLQGL
jgi:ATP-binding cassette, subfamily B, bacterial PglK